MTTHDIEFDTNAMISACPKCGNNTEFVLHSHQVDEDIFEVWAQCKCGYEHNHQHKFANVFGSVLDESVSLAMDCWNKCCYLLTDQAKMTLNDIFQLLRRAIKEITDPLFASYSTYQFDFDNDSLELIAKPDNQNSGVKLVLRLIVHHEQKWMGVTNILIPDEMQHYGHGKRILAKIFDVASYHGYYLYVLDPVESFSRRLIKRGALKIDEDKLLITKETRLLQ